MKERLAAILAATWGDLWFAARPHSRLDNHYLRDIEGLFVVLCVVAGMLFGAGLILPKHRTGFGRF